MSFRRTVREQSSRLISSVFSPTVDEYLRNEPYISEGVWEKIEVETMNVVLVNGEKKQ